MSNVVDPFHKYKQILDAYTAALAGRDPDAVEIQDLLPGIFKAVPSASVPDVVDALRWGSRQARKEAMSMEEYGHRKWRA